MKICIHEYMYIRFFVDMNIYIYICVYSNLFIYIHMSIGKFENMYTFINVYMFRCKSVECMYV